jgi:hypothetical protein
MVGKSFGPDNPVDQPLLIRPNASPGARWRAYTPVFFPGKSETMGGRGLKARGGVLGVILVVAVLGYGILSGQLSPGQLLEEP